MLIKPRVKSTDHFILESLYYRMSLSFDDRKRVENQAKGFEGERRFDHFINHSEQQGFVVPSTNKSIYIFYEWISVLRDKLFYFVR